MKLNIAICEDEEAIREQLNELIEKEIPGICPEIYETENRCLLPRGRLILCPLIYKQRGRTAGNMFFIEIENSFDGMARPVGMAAFPYQRKRIRRCMESG